jgi:hypothetical protein
MKTLVTNKETSYACFVSTWVGEYANHGEIIAVKKQIETTTTKKHREYHTKCLNITVSYCVIIVFVT